MLEELQAALDEAAAAHDVPGAVVAVLDGDQEYIVCTGVGSVRTGERVTPDTQFHIGSTSKTFAGTLAMALVDEGLFTLETPITDILSDYRLGDADALAALRVKHLLTHSGGFLGDTDALGSWDSDALARSVAKHVDLPQLFAPGTVASYSNSGFVLLARVCEVAAGEPYEDLVRTRIFEPLGMTTSFYFPWDAITRPNALGHMLQDGEQVVVDSWGIGRDGAGPGGISSTPGDMLRYARFHMRGEASGSAPVSEETRLDMQQPHMQVGPPLDSIGYSWLLSHRGHARTVQHGGNISNQLLSEFVMFPDEDLAVAVMTNSLGGGTLGPQMVTWVAKHARGIETAVEEPELRTGDDLDEVLGVYSVGQWTQTVTRDGDDLLVQMAWREDIAEKGVPTPPASRLRLTVDDRLLNAAGTAAGRFMRDADGAPEFLHLGLRAGRRL